MTRITGNYRRRRTPFSGVFCVIASFLIFIIPPL